MGDHRTCEQSEPKVGDRLESGIYSGGDTVQELEPAGSTALPGFEDEQQEASTAKSQPGGAEDAPFSTVSDEGHGDALVDPEVIEHYLLEVYYGPLVTSSGTVSMFLKHHVRVDISVDRAVRVVNFAKHCMAAFSRFGDRSCVCHPCGRALQEGCTVDVETGKRLAKISRRGVTFTAFHGRHLHGLVYLVDNSGTKSTTERFKVLRYDLALNVFRCGSEQGSHLINSCFEIVAQSIYESTENGDFWLVGGVHIIQRPSGDVEVSPDYGRNVIFTSPTDGSISMNTPISKIIVSCCPDRFLFVSMGRKRLCVSAERFVVRNGGQKAGLDSMSRLSLR
ncbi:hypothetical protein V5799_012469 [Amblyomma americanum]|uniref:Uncharacterized protein n=1 Tax=Amblyomma americanum TaxID=6943 RepID=A0AAQ4EDX5_AMBAM